jgi:hypothetical protein
MVPGRTKVECYTRWYAALGDPNVDWANKRSGKWTEDEDIKLKDAVQMQGGKDLVAVSAMVPGGKGWAAISALVLGRTRAQCYSRWHDVLAPHIDRANGRTGKWAEDEDIKLKNAIQTHGGKNWPAIAAMVPGRTEKQCCVRWIKNLDPKRSTVREEEHAILDKAPALGDRIGPPLEA